MSDRPTVTQQVCRCVLTGVPRARLLAGSHSCFLKIIFIYPVKTPNPLINQLLHLSRFEQWKHNYFVLWSWSSPNPKHINWISPSTCHFSTCSLQDLGQGCLPIPKPWHSGSPGSVQHQCSTSAAVTQPQQTGASQCYFTGALISNRGIFGGASFLTYFIQKTELRMWNFRISHRAREI